MIEEDLQDLAAGFVGQLLRVARIGNRFLLWGVGQTNMAQGSVRISCEIGPRDSRGWHIADKDPFDFENAFPFVLCPDR